MKTAKREIRWQAKAGEAVATVTATAGWREWTETINADGDKMQINRHELVDSAKWLVTIAGKTYAGYLCEAPAIYRKQGVLATIDKVGITDAVVYAAAQKALDEAQAEARMDNGYQTAKANAATIGAQHKLASDINNGRSKF